MNINKWKINIFEKNDNNNNNNINNIIKKDD